MSAQFFNRRAPGPDANAGRSKESLAPKFRLPAGCRSPAAARRGISPERRNGADEPAVGSVGPDRVRMPTSTPSATAAATTSPARSDRTALMEAARSMFVTLPMFNIIPRI